MNIPKGKAYMPTMKNNCTYDDHSGNAANDNDASSTAAAITDLKKERKK
jgi:hypothetical protein